MQCLKNPNRPTQAAICANCRRRCVKAGKNRRYRELLKLEERRAGRAGGEGA